MKRELIERCIQKQPQAVGALVEQTLREWGGIAVVAAGQAASSRRAELAATAVAGVLGELRRAPTGPRFQLWLKKQGLAAVWPSRVKPVPGLARALGERYAPLSEEVTPQQIRETLSQMLPEHRRALWLVTAEGHTVEEAAELAGLVPAAFAEELHEAFEILRRQLNDVEDTRAPLSEAEPAWQLAYHDHDEPTRKHLERELAQSRASTAAQQIIRRERARIAAAFEVPLESGAVMSALQEKVRLGSRRLPATTWVAVHILVLAALIAGLVALADYVPAPEVELRLEAGGASHGRWVADAADAGGLVLVDERDLIRAGTTTVAAEQQVEEVAEPAAASESPSESEEAAPRSLAPGEAVRTDAFSRVRLRINGNHEVQLGSDTLLALEPPRAVTPVHLHLARGTAYLNARGADRLVRLDTPGLHLLGNRAEGIVRRTPDGLTVFVLAGTVEVAAPAGVALDGVTPRTDVAPRLAAALPQASYLAHLEAGQGAFFPLAGDTATGSSSAVRAVAAPEPLPRYRRAGFNVASFEEPDKAELAISPSFVRRLYLGTDGGLKVRLHWLNPSRFPLSVDELPPHLLPVLDESYQARQALRESRARLRDEVEAAAVQSTDLSLLAADLEREARALELEYGALRQAHLELLAWKEERHALERRWLRQSGAGPDYESHVLASDPLGLTRFSLQAERDAVRAELSRLEEVERRMLVDELALGRVEPRYESVRAELAEHENELEQMRTRHATLTAQLEGLEELAEQKRGLEREQRNLEETLRATQRLLEETRAELTEANERRPELAEEVARAEESAERLAEAEAAHQQAVEAAQAAKARRAELEDERERLAEQKAQLQQELEGQRARRIEAQRRLVEEQAHKEQAAETVAEAQAKHRQAQQATEEARRARAEARDELRTAEHEHDDAQQALAQARQSVEEAQAKRADHAERLESAERELAQAVAHLEEVQVRHESTHAAVQEARAEVERQEARFAQLERQLQELRSERAEAQRWAAETQARLEAAQRRNAELEAHARRKAELAEQLAQLAAQQETLQSEHSQAHEAYTEAQEAHVQAQNMLEHTRETVAKLAELLEELEARYERDSQRARELEERLENAQEVYERAGAEVRELAQRHEALEQAVREAQASLVASQEEQAELGEKLDSSLAQLEALTRRGQQLAERWDAAYGRLVRLRAHAANADSDKERERAEEERAALAAELAELTKQLDEVGTDELAAQQRVLEKAQRYWDLADTLAELGEVHAQRKAELTSLRTRHEAARTAYESAEQTREHFHSERERVATELTAIEEGLEAVRRRLESRETQLRELTERAEDAEQEVARHAEMYHELEERLAAVERDVHNLEAERKSVRQRFDELGGDSALEELSEEVAQRETELAEANALVATLTGTRDELLEQREHVEHLIKVASDTLAEREAAWQEVRGPLREAQQASDAARERRNTARQALDDARQTLVQARETIEEYEAKVREADERVTALQQRLERRVSTYEQAQHNLEQAGEQSEEARQVLEQLHATVRDLEQRLEEQSEEYERIHASLGSLHERVKQHDERLAILRQRERETQEKVELAAEELEHAQRAAGESELEALQEAQRALIENIRKLGEKRRTLQRNTIRKRRELNNLERRISDLSEALYRREGFEEERDELATRISSSESQLEELVQERNELAERVEPRRERIAEAQAQLAERPALNEQLAELDEQQHSLRRRELDAQRSRNRLIQLEQRITQLREEAGPARLSAHEREMTSFAEQRAEIAARKADVRERLAEANEQLETFHERIFQPRREQLDERLLRRLVLEAAGYEGLQLHMDEARSALQAAIDLLGPYRERIRFGTATGTDMDTRWSQRLTNLFRGDERLGTIRYLTRDDLLPPGRYVFDTSPREAPDPPAEEDSGEATEQDASESEGSEAAGEESHEEEDALDPHNEDTHENQNAAEADEENKSSDNDTEDTTSPEDETGNASTNADD